MPGKSHQRALGRRERGPWYERNGGARLEYDRGTVVDFGQDLAYRIDHGARHVSLEGRITLVEASCSVPTPIGVHLEFPDAYPDNEPVAYVAPGTFPFDIDRHILPDGMCCLWLTAKSRWDPNDEDALRPFLDEFVVFLDRQLVLDALPPGVPRVWPGGQYAHGARGFLQYIEETLGGDARIVSVFLPMLLEGSPPRRHAPCPCGSGLRYGRCHSGAVEELSRQIGASALRRLDAWLVSLTRGMARANTA